MRVSYSLSYETYSKLQGPFQSPESVGRGLFMFLYFVTIEVGIGVTMISGDVYAFLRHHAAPKPGWFVSVEVLGFGVSLMMFAWVFRIFSIRNAAREHADFLRESYGRLHCKNRRFVEANESGLVLGCDCKSETEDWGQILSWGEIDSVLLIWARKNTVSIPNDAFVSEGERTEFRKILAERIGETKVVMSRSVEFRVNQLDWYHAKWLLFKRGGWAQSGRLLLSALSLGVLIQFFLPFFGAKDAWSAPHLIGAFGFTLVAFFLLDPLRRLRPGRVLSGAMKVWFADDAIYVRSEAFALRIPWGLILWCVADSKTVLFLYRPGGLLLIPLRAVGQAQIKYLLQSIVARLPAYV